MASIYNASILLGIALLALVIPVFVLTVSLLGRAIENATREREQAERRQRNETQNKIETVKQALDEAQTSGDLQKVPDYKKDLRRLQKLGKRRLRRIERSSQVLTAEGSVVYPGLLFLLATALSSSALLLSGRPIGAVKFLNWGLVPWLFSLAFTVLGILRLWKCLKVVQSIAVTSEEATFRHNVTALKQALREVQEETLPEIRLLWRGEAPPFVFEAKTTTTIGFAMTLSRGPVAEHTETWFFAPPGFEFPDMRSWLQDDDHGDISGFVTTAIKETEPLIKGTNYVRSLKIKMPQKEGAYTLYYLVKCAGFLSEREAFSVEVEPESVPF